jgi:xylan 1,4-beta-xylosidase
LKWGSTNAYREDQSGPHLRLDDPRSNLRHVSEAWRPAAVEIGFMPKALSTKPEPYQFTWTPTRSREIFSAGRSRRPTTEKWGDLVHAWAARGRAAASLK